MPEAFGKGVFNLFTFAITICVDDDRGVGKKRRRKVFLHNVTPLHHNATQDHGIIAPRRKIKSNLFCSCGDILHRKILTRLFRDNEQLG